MTTTRKVLLAGSAAAALIGSMIALEHDGDDPVPLTVTVCCEGWPGGKCYSLPPSRCPASHDLVSCCAPASEPDGSISCGC